MRERGRPDVVPRFIIGYSGRPANQVRMTVDKSRHNHAASSIDGRAWRARQDFQSAAGTNIMDQPVDDKNRAILNEAKVSEIGPAPGTARSAQRQELPGAPY